jgi:LysM domain.
VLKIEQYNLVLAPISSYWNNLEYAEKRGDSTMYHWVNQYETLHTIAGFHGTTVNQLIALNPDISNPNMIYPGQRIRIR